MKKQLQTTFSTRQYMLSRDFEIYYYNDTFEDSHYYGVNSHAHNYYEFYLFLEGNVSMNIEGARFMRSNPGRCDHHSTTCSTLRDFTRRNNSLSPFCFWISDRLLQSTSPAFAGLCVSDAARTCHKTLHFSL